jgi:ribosomal protein S18 acetylase RimI-like enzyme
MARAPRNLFPTGRPGRSIGSQETVSTTMAIVIRPYIETDRPVLRALTIAAFEGVSIDQNIDRLLGPVAGQDWRSRKGRHVDDDIDSPGGELAVAEDSELGRPVGYVSMRIDAASLVGWIPNLVVDAQVRNQGLGRRLLEHALDRFRAQGMTVARIETLAQNPIGSHLYPAVGFQEVARQIHFAMPLQNNKE